MMKKIYFLSLFIFAFSGVSFGQWATSGTNIYYNGGNVGIGTPSPTQALDVRGNLRVNYGMESDGIFGYSSSGNQIMSITRQSVPVNGSLSINSYGAFGIVTGNMSGQPTTDYKLTVMSNGYVGLGSSSPSYSLDIQKNGSSLTAPAIRIQGFDNSAYSGAYLLLSKSRGSTKGSLVTTLQDDQLGGIDFYGVNENAGNGLAARIVASQDGTAGPSHIPGSLSFLTSSGSATAAVRMSIFSNGSVGIGTNDSKGYKFAVNGSAIATSVTVKAYGSWPDYVLNNDYELPSLADVKRYINQNRHLPDMPSAAEVEKDGLDLGEMNKLLLKKVEELTLYLIEMKGHNDCFTKQIEQLKTKITALEKNQ